MATIYVGIVIVLLALAVFDLIVGVSNDAVNFLNSAIGAKAAKFRTVLIIASIGVIVGAVMSNGMMDIARHGIMLPVNFTFQEVMTIFLAVMVTDVIILDTFNSLGMPTSTTVSMVFELLGGTFVIATIKKMSDAAGTLDYGDLLNTDKALTVIISIFMSVAIAFVFGLIVQWISRIIFTFNYHKHLRYTVALFGGIAFTTLTYFMFFKGVVNATFISDDTKAWVGANTDMLLIATFVCSTILMEALHLLRVDIFKIIVLMGTFALAMAFAGNDLVNFIGVPLAGLSSVQDFLANGHGQYSTYTMGVLMESAHTPPVYLLTAGLIMVVATVTSKKSQNVVKTSVDLARQDEGDEMFGSSRVARSLVRATSQVGKTWTAYCLRR
jgi:phosphate/sulfate permease